MARRMSDPIEPDRAGEVAIVARAQLEVFRAPRDGQWQEHFTLTASDTIRPVSFPEIEFPLKGFLVGVQPH